MRRVALLFVVVFLIGLSAVLGGVTHVSAEDSDSEDSQVVVERIPQSSVANGLVERVQASWPWYLTRASGIVAAITCVILMLSGIGLLTGHTFSFLEPITAWASHRALGIAFGISVLLHVIALYFDSFVPFNLIDLLVPFASTYKRIDIFGLPVGSLYVALGVLSLYIIAAVVITSLLWIEKKPKLWKVTHLLSYMAMIFVFVHALYLGTDLSHGILRWIWVALAGVVLIASFARLWRAKTV